MYAHERDALIVQYLPMCWQVARRIFFRWPYCRKFCEVEDLYQTGVIGLIQAVDRWDPTRPFPPYAWRSIYQVVWQHLREWRLVRASRSNQTECQAIDTQADMTFVHGGVSPDDEVERRQLVAAAMQRIAMFRLQKRQVVELYFGLAGKPPMTLEDVGKVLGISSNAACLQKQDALRRLRDMLEV